MNLAKRPLLRFLIACLIFGATMAIYFVITGRTIQWVSVCIGLALFAVLYGSFNLLIGAGTSDSHKRRR